MELHLILSDALARSVLIMGMDCYMRAEDMVYDFLILYKSSLVLGDDFLAKRFSSSCLKVWLKFYRLHYTN